MNNDFKSKIVELARAAHINPNRVTRARFLKAHPMYNLSLADGLHLIVSMSDEEFKQIRDSTVPPVVTDQDVAAVKAKRNNKETKADTEEALFVKELETALTKILKSYGPVVPIPLGGARPIPGNFTTSLVLSDLHFGSCFTEGTVQQPYGRKEESRRLAKVIQQTIARGRGADKLVLHLLGDLIPNVIHDSDGDTLADQCCSVIHYIVQAVALLSVEFPAVEVHCAVGNHDRWPHQHTRIMRNKFDSLGSVIYYGIKQAVRNLPNVSINLYKTPFYKIPIRGHQVLCTHGDTMLDPGNPGEAIKIGSMEKQLARLSELTHDVKLVAVGHVHVPAFTVLSNGAVFITNGTTMPTDQYANSLGYLSNNAGQWMWKSTDEEVWASSSLLRVGQHDDEDESLDKIINPYKTLID